MHTLIGIKVLGIIIGFSAIGICLKWSYANTPKRTGIMIHHEVPVKSYLYRDTIQIKRKDATIELFGVKGYEMQSNFILVY